MFVDKEKKRVFIWSGFGSLSSFWLSSMLRRLHKSEVKKKRKRDGGLLEEGI